MTRYEFEVLSHLERNGAGQYSLRTLSDALTISGGEISRCLEQLAAKHWITQRRGHPRRHGRRLGRAGALPGKKRDHSRRRVRLPDDARHC